MGRNVNGFRGMLNAKAAAAYVGIHVSSFRKWLKNSDVETPAHYQLGLRTFFKPEDLDAWIERLKKN